MTNETAAKYIIKNETVPAHMAYLSSGKWLGKSFARKFDTAKEAQDLATYLQMSPGGNVHSYTVETV